MRSTTELFRLMGKEDAEISIMCWVCSTSNLDASPEPGNTFQDHAYDILGITKAGIRCVLNDGPWLGAQLRGTVAFRGSGSVAMQASIFHDTRLASVVVAMVRKLFAWCIGGDGLARDWQSNFGLMSASRLALGRVLCRRHYTRDARSRCMKEAQQPTYSSTCTGNQGRLYALCCTYQVLSEFGQSQPLFSPVSPPRASSLLEKLPGSAKSARLITSAWYFQWLHSRRPRIHWNVT